MRVNLFLLILWVQAMVRGIGTGIQSGQTGFCAIIERYSVMVLFSVHPAFLMKSRVYVSY